ncbi:angiopoietin-2-like [Aedes albopictus]|uniref:Fibrinogen C-terminal domain-containing protein n=1 Tax=Aedes albopictus TaxID=7160 RepID=A0ABM1Y450_AEDAL
MFDNVRLILCAVMLLWCSKAQSAEGNYDDVITKLDNLLYRVVMSEVNIKERLEETEGQLKKTLEQLDTLMGHQSDLVQNDDQLLSKIEEQYEKLKQNQENIREEFTTMVVLVGEEVSDEFNVLRSNMDQRFGSTEEGLERLIKKQDDFAANHETLANELVEMEKYIGEKIMLGMTNLGQRFDETGEKFEEIRQNQENGHAELSLKLMNMKNDIDHNFNMMVSNVIEGFENADIQFDRLMQNRDDVGASHDELTSILTKLEQFVGEQYITTLTNITSQFDRTNNQIDDLARNQDNSRSELSSKLTSMKQDMTNQFNVIASSVTEGFSKTDVGFDRLTQTQSGLAANQQTFSSALTKMNNDVNDQLGKISSNINDRSDKLENQHKTTKDQLDRLLQNLENHRVELTMAMIEIEHSTNQNFDTLTNYAEQILQQQGNCSTPVGPEEQPEEQPEKQPEEQPEKQPEPQPEDVEVITCKTIGSSTSGLYQLKPFGTNETLIEYCEQEKFGGGWLVMQYRFDGSEDFYRNWNEYKNGFGTYAGEFWIGLEKIHRLTNNKNVELIVELKDYHNNYIYARYDAFEIGSEAQKYSLEKLGTYSGTAGNSMKSNAGKKFTTKDNDNDGAASLNCAVSRMGAWWFDWGYSGDFNGMCGAADLNGMYGVRGDWQSIFWYGYNQYDGMKYTRMMIREV